MGRMPLALLAIGAAALPGVAPAPAVGTEYPFSIQGDVNPALSNCTFTSYQQCQATASGRATMARPYRSYRSDYNRSREIPPGGRLIGSVGELFNKSCKRS